MCVTVHHSAFLCSPCLSKLDLRVVPLRPPEKQEQSSLRLFLFLFSVFKYCVILINECRSYNLTNENVEWLFFRNHFLSVPQRVHEKDALVLVQWPFAPLSSKVTLRTVVTLVPWLNNTNTFNSQSRHLCTLQSRCEEGCQGSGVRMDGWVWDYWDYGDGQQCFP